MRAEKIGIVYSKKRAEAQKAYKQLKRRYDLVPLDRETAEDVDVVVALGGDGLLLHMLHEYAEYNLPFYGMNCGTVGFMMNLFEPEGLLERLAEAKATIIHPLSMVAHSADGSSHALDAINEVSLLRSRGQAAKIRISVDGKVQIEELVADGVLVSTAAGSSAYNFSVGGPIIPLKSNVLALTPISPFRPRRWRGALLPHDTSFRFDILDHEMRPVNAVADYLEVRDVVSVEVHENTSTKIKLLFDKGHSLEDRIIREQFVI